ALGLGLCGCANFWDQVSSHEFHISDLFVKKDPLSVLHDSDDGNERRKALAVLQEPLPHGGTQKDQDAVVQILTTAATTERDSLCRMAAIRSLGHFQDPRAAEAIDAVYLQKLPF